MSLIGYHSIRICTSAPLCKSSNAFLVSWAPEENFLSHSVQMEHFSPVCIFQGINTSHRLVKPFSHSPQSSPWTVLWCMLHFDFELKAKTAVWTYKDLSAKSLTSVFNQDLAGGKCLLAHCTLTPISHSVDSLVYLQYVCLGELHNWVCLCFLCPLKRRLAFY